MKSAFQFLNRLNVSPLPDGVFWFMTSDFKGEGSMGGHHFQLNVPTNFRTDFASIPPLARIAGIVMLVALHFHWAVLQWVALVVILLSNSLGHTGRYTRAAVFHDYLYSTESRLGRLNLLKGFRKVWAYLIWGHSFRAQADWCLYLAMRACNTNLGICLIIWVNVRLFGFRSYHYRRIKSYLRTGHYRLK